MRGGGAGRQPPRQRFGPLPPTDAAGASGDFQPGREGEEENKQIKEVVALSWWLFFVFFFLFVRLFCGFFSALPSPPPPSPAINGTRSVAAVLRGRSVRGIGLPVATK